MRILFFITLGLVSQFSAAQPCEELQKKAYADETRIPGDKAMHIISGKGRAYFHTAPASSCISKQLFLVPGDSVIAYGDYDEFTSVLYFHPKTNKETQGWILTERLKATRTGIAPKQDALE